MNYLIKTLNASVYDVAVKTPLDEAAELSKRMGVKFLLKREDLQPVHSYKIRGAYNKMRSLPAEALRKGVLAASAGNHAQGVALSAKKLGVKATIVMPETTPEIKINAVKAYGAEIVLHGVSYSDCAEEAARLVKTLGLTFIPPYDDPDVIAGQGTVGREIIDDAGADIDAIFVPIGGGGLAAGVSSYVKKVRPSVKVYGVEPEDSDCMYRSIKAGRRVTLETPGLFADGVCVKKPGEETFRLPQPFLVMATQNPIEQEGTYPLPEAQLDRFMLKVVVTYPKREEERQIVRMNNLGEFPKAEAVIKPEDIVRAREVVKEVYMDEKIERYIVDLVYATRTPDEYNLGKIANYISYGASPRASISLAAASKAYAFIKRRGYVIPEDVRAVCFEVLRHRIGLTYEAEAENITTDQIISEIINAVEVP